MSRYDRRTREQAAEAALYADPVAYHRLVTVHEALEENRDTVEAQVRRRNEAIYELIKAGVSYADIGRIVDLTSERVRQLVARHMGIDVDELNPRPTEAVNRH